MFSEISSGPLALSGLSFSSFLANTSSLKCRSIRVNCAPDFSLGKFASNGGSSTSTEAKYWLRISDLVKSSVIVSLFSSRKVYGRWRSGEMAGVIPKLLGSSEFLSIRLFSKCALALERDSETVVLFWWSILSALSSDVLALTKDLRALTLALFTDLYLVHGGLWRAPGWTYLCGTYFSMSSSYKALKESQQWSTDFSTQMLLKSTSASSLLIPS